MQEIRQVFTKPEEMYSAAARYLADVLQQSAGTKEIQPFSLVLTGGSTPAPLYTRLASVYPYLPWSQTHFFWGDERYVSPTDEASNYKMAYDTLLSRLPLRPEQIHRIPTEHPDIAQAAAAYEQEITAYFSGSDGNNQQQPVASSRRSIPAFSLTLLGMGADGHVASLFPHTPALQVTDRLVTHLDKAPLAPRVARITMTLPLLNNSERVVFLITGTEKLALLQKIAADPVRAQELYPVTHIRARRELVWFLSEE